MKTRVLFKLISFVLFFLLGYSAISQNVIPTKGKRFWLGFMENYQNGSGESLDVFIASDNNTSGTIEIPGQGWSENFTVLANQITTITLPQSAECVGNQQIFDNGVYVETEDTVAVFAINFVDFSSDAAKILPIQSLGTEYRISSYPGLSGLGSEFIIVATEDGTEVEITPSDDMDNGEPAGVPFIVNLDQGEAYHVKSSNANTDYTGTLIKGTEISGDCRPFAVFAGTSCVNIPVGCTFCDHIFDQHFPLSTWGTEFYTVPFDFTSGYTLRVLAHEDNTVVTTDMGVINLDAGEFEEYNQLNQPLCITSNLGISVTQYMQGVSCSGDGDPAMSILNDADQMIDKISFSTVESDVIVNHGLNIIINSSDIGTLTLDGNTLPASEFTEYPDCSQKSYAQIDITEGVHNLESANGVTAYVFGTGEAESYFYSVGSFSSDPVEIENVTCSNDTITLVIDGEMIDVEWFTQTDPETVVGTGPSLVLVPPIISDIYVAVGNQFLSGCSSEELFSVEVPDPPMLETFQSETEVCQYQSVQLGVDVEPFSTAYNYLWSPAAGLDDPTIQNPVATPLSSTTYSVYVYTNSGCGSNIAELTVDVIDSDFPFFEILSDDFAICEGEDATLNLNIEEELFEDNFDPDINPSLWDNIQQGIPSDNCGSETGNALWFNGAGIRVAETVPMDVSSGGTVTVSMKIGTGTFPCDNADLGEDVVLEYNATGTWVLLETYNQAAYPVFTPVSTPIPAAAQTIATSFRWRQLANGGDMEDNWAIDNVYISQNSALTGYTWSPDYNISSLTDASVVVDPQVDTTYYVDYFDPNTGCSYTDSLEVLVDESFAITLMEDTTLCDVAGIELNAQPDVSGDYTWEWTGNALSSNFIQNPIATPTATTTYSVVVTSLNGCAIEDEVTVEVFTLFDLEINAAETVLCYGEDVQLIGQINGNTSGAVFQWTPSTGLSDPTILNPIASPETTTNYTLSVSSANDECSISESIEIEVVPEISVDAGEDAILCELDGFQLNASTDYPNSLDWQWNNAGNLNDPTIPNPTVSSSTSLSLEVEVTAENGCTATDDIELTLLYDAIDLGPTISFCEGESVVIGGSLGEEFTYNWNTSETTRTIEVSEPGLYSVIVTSDEGCEFEDEIQVNMNPVPIIDFGEIEILCEGQFLTLNAGNPGSSYLWSTDQVSQSISVSESDVYSVTVTNGFGCVSSEEVDLTFFSNPAVNLEPLYRICEGEQVNLNAANPNSQYAWSTGETTSDIWVSESENIGIVVTNEFGCTASDNVSVIVEPTPYVDLGEDLSLCVGEVAQLNTNQPDYAYSWSNGSTAPSLLVSTSGEYAVTASTEYCTYTDQVTVSFEEAPENYLPVSQTFCFDNCPYDLVLNAGNFDVSYLWNDGSTSKELTVYEPGLYTVEISTPLGCKREYSADIIEVCKDDNVYVPNAFSPNGDGINDIFKVSAPEGIEDFKFRIFNRYGQLMFITSDPSKGWNGEVDDTNYYSETEMFVYTIQYTYFIDCEGTERDIYEGEGHITLLR